MATLKKDTIELINASRNGRGKPDPYDDLIDEKITDLIEQINDQSHLATTGSSSGRDGNPFISLVFKDSNVRDHVLHLFKEAGFYTQKSGRFRMVEFFQETFPDIVVHEEWSVGCELNGDCTEEISSDFWIAVAQILVRRE